jgi:hypothetical protein
MDHILAVAHGQGHSAVLADEVRFTQHLPLQFAARGDHQFHQRGAALAQVVVRESQRGFNGDMSAVLQGTDAVQITAHLEHITFFEHHVATGQREPLFLPADLDDIHIEFLHQGTVHDALAHGLGTFQDLDLGDVPAHAELVAKVLGLSAIGQQTATDEGQVQHTNHHENEAERGLIEHAEAFHTERCQHTAHHDVGTGAKQGDHPAHDGGIAQRDQQLAGRQAAGMGHLHHHRHHERHHRGIVHERTEQGHHHGEHEHADDRVRAEQHRELGPDGAQCPGAQ